MNQNPYRRHSCTGYYEAWEEGYVMGKLDAPGHSKEEAIANAIKTYYNIYNNDDWLRRELAYAGFALVRTRDLFQDGDNPS